MNSVIVSIAPTAARSVVGTSWIAASGSPAAFSPATRPAWIACAERRLSEPPRRIAALPGLQAERAGVGGDVRPALEDHARPPRAACAPGGCAGPTAGPTRRSPARPGRAGRRSRAGPRPSPRPAPRRASAGRASPATGRAPRRRPCRRRSPRAAPRDPPRSRRPRRAAPRPSRSDGAKASSAARGLRRPADVAHQRADVHPIVHRRPPLRSPGRRGAPAPPGPAWPSSAAIRSDRCPMMTRASPAS